MVNHSIRKLCRAVEKTARADKKRLIEEQVREIENYNTTTQVRPTT